MSKRVETGPMRFGEDWTGIYIRGDNAMCMAQDLKMLDHYIANGIIAPAHFRDTIQRMADLLDSCSMLRGPNSVNMKPYDEALA